MKKMQVTLKQNLLADQLKAVINNMVQTDNDLNVAALDKNVSINRSLFLFFSPLLRSILGNISSSDWSSVLLILPANSLYLLELQKMLLEGSDKMTNERQNLDDIVNLCSYLGVRITVDEVGNCDKNSIPGVQPTHKATNREARYKSGTEIKNMESPLKGCVKIKLEPKEYNEIDQCAPDESSLGSLKMEPKTNDIEGSQTDALLSEEPTDEELNLDIDVLEIEPNEKEMHDLLTATKTEIEKFLLRNPNKNVPAVKETTAVSQVEETLVSTVEAEKISDSAFEALVSAAEHEESMISFTEGEESSTSVKNNESQAETKEMLRYKHLCYLCSYKTNYSVSLKEHVKTTHQNAYHINHRSTEKEPKPEFQCSICGFKTDIPDFIQVHMKNMHDSYYIFRCSSCDFDTSRYHKLSSHDCTPQSGSKPLSNRVVSDGTPSSLCMRCGKFHATPCIRPLDGMCDYPDCGKTSHSKSLHYPSTMELYRAIQLKDSSICLELPPATKGRSVGVKKNKGPLYPCNQCGYKTNKASMIKFHTKKSHQSQYQFSCDICLFSTTDNKMFPSHKCKELIKCPQCDFTATKSLLIKRHISSQHEVQIYSCGQCNYKCTTLDSFQQHQLFLCKLDVEESKSHRSTERELFLCDRCDYEGRDIHSLRKHKTTVHINSASNRQLSSRSGVRSPIERSRSPLRRVETYSPRGRSPIGHTRNHSRNSRTPIRRRRRSSSRSQASSRGPSTPFPQLAFPFNPINGEDMFPTQPPSRPRPNTSRPRGPRRKHAVGRQKNILLCLKCGRRHGGECMHPDDSWCSQPSCGRTGHVVTLHHPKTLNDFRLIKAKIKIPGFSVNEPRQ